MANASVAKIKMDTGLRRYDEDLASSCAMKMVLALRTKSLDSGLRRNDGDLGCWRCRHGQPVGDEDQNGYRLDPLSCCEAHRQDYDVSLTPKAGENS